MKEQNAKSLEQWVTRREFLTTSFGFAAICASSYGTWFEPFWLEVTKKFLRVDDTATRPLRILHLSDLHAFDRTPMSFIEQAIDRAIDLQPDIICLTGDYITTKLGNTHEYIRILERLPNAAPTFATLGNHDGGKWAARCGGYSTTFAVERVLESAGITLLKNEGRQLQLNGRNYLFVGLTDYWEGAMDPKAAFANCASSEHACTILLSHNPDTKDELVNYPWTLMLSGHTHGGQVKIPILGITPCVPVRDRRFVAGLYPWEGKWLHITRGIGSTGGVRVNCPPEVSLLEVYA